MSKLRLRRIVFSLHGVAQFVKFQILLLGCLGRCAHKFDMFLIEMAQSGGTVLISSASLEKFVGARHVFPVVLGLEDSSTQIGIVMFFTIVRRRLIFFRVVTRRGRTEWWQWWGGGSSSSHWDLSDTILNFEAICSLELKFTIFAPTRWWIDHLKWGICSDNSIDLLIKNRLE